MGSLNGLPWQAGLTIADKGCPVDSIGRLPWVPGLAPENFRGCLCCVVLRTSPGLQAIVILARKEPSRPGGPLQFRSAAGSDALVPA